MARSHSALPRVRGNAPLRCRVTCNAHAIIAWVSQAIYDFDPRSSQQPEYWWSRIKSRRAGYEPIKPEIITISFANTCVTFVQQTHATVDLIYFRGCFRLHTNTANTVVYSIFSMEIINVGNFPFIMFMILCSQNKRHFKKQSFRFKVKKRMKLSSSVKFLGIIIDKNLTWKEHFQIFLKEHHKD